MELHNLKPAKGAVNKDKRVGRGQGSTRGGTATRGHKGQKSRSGYSKAFGFEGGQMPLQRRVPKHGFKNINRKEYKGINLSTLQELSEKKKINKIDVDTLIKAGLATKKTKIKILGNGKLDAKLEVKAHAFSEAAKKAIEAKQGSIEKIQ
jgi:large subunit ribosomal protein L15